MGAGRAITKATASGLFVAAALLGGCDVPPGDAAAGDSPQQRPITGATTNPTCENTDGCVDSRCDVGDARYQATADVVEDATNGHRLWQRGFHQAGAYADSAAYCAALVLDGLAGWRLPSNPEMGTLVLNPAGLGANPDACVPSLDQAAFAFPDPSGDQFFWTSSASGPGPGLRLTRNFSDGRSPPDYEDDTLVFTRCTHDPIAAPPN